jgi:opacity protein-like surface antigen
MKSTKYLAIFLVLLVSTIAARAARADDADAFSKNGPYLGIGASYGVPLFEPSLDNAFNGAGLSEKVSNTWGLNARAGYRFHKFLAAEVEYEWLQHFGMRVNGIGLGSVRAQTITANLKAIAPYGRWQPYVLAGFGATLAKYTETTGSPLNVQPTSYSTRFGLGLDYYLSENIALNLGSEFVVNTAKMSNDINGDSTSRGLDYYSAQGGLVFKF